LLLKYVRIIAATSISLNSRICSFCSWRDRREGWKK